MFGYLVIRRACLHVNVKHRRALFNFIDAHTPNDVKLLLERILVAFEVDVVYNLLEHVKAIVWAVVRNVYAQNFNLLSMNRHQIHFDYVAVLLRKVAKPKRLFKFCRDLFKRYCIYEMAQDTVPWEDLVKLLCTMNSMFHKKTIIDTNKNSRKNVYRYSRNCNSNKLCKKLNKCVT